MSKWDEIGRTIYEPKEESLGKYQRKIGGFVVDVYDILVAYNVTNPAIAHAIKKLLMPGERGHKDASTDVREARDSIDRALQLMEQTCQERH